MIPRTLKPPLSLPRLVTLTAGQDQPPEAELAGSAGACSVGNANGGNIYQSRCLPDTQVSRQLHAGRPQPQEEGPREGQDNGARAGEKGVICEEGFLGGRAEGGYGGGSVGVWGGIHCLSVCCEYGLQIEGVCVGCTASLDLRAGEVAVAVAGAIWGFT